MRIPVIIFISLLLQGPVQAQHKGKDTVLMFCYFINNGEDGLHLAYSRDGYKWSTLNHEGSILRPFAGHDRLMRDPCIIKGPDGLFHMVWTAGWNEKGIGYANSRDLIHWSTQQYIPVMESEKDALNCWAPEIIYDNTTKRYMIYWATTIPGRFPEGDTSDEGKYNHRIYYTTTKDFKKFSPAAILYNKGFSVIDATIHKEKNFYFMFLKNETLKPFPEKNIRIATSRHLTYGYGEPSASITGEYWAEGPTVIKWKGQWFVYFDKYRDHSYGALISRDLKKWKDISRQLDFPGGARHGTVFTISGNELEKIKSGLP